MKLCWIPLATTLFIATTASAQNRIGTGNVKEIYREHCASCHGKKLEGGLGGSLLEGPWQHGGDSAAITRITTEGALDVGMPAFGDTLSAAEIRAITIFILEERDIHDSKPAPVDSANWSNETVFTAGDVDFRVEILASSDAQLWAIDFLPDGTLIATERDGKLRLLKDGELGPAISGTPDVLVGGQGGLLDVGVHPDYAENGWIYLSYSEADGSGADKPDSMTAVVRGRIKDGKWVDQEEIFHARTEDFVGSRNHFGSRFVFLDGYLYFGIGDRGNKERAQDLTKPNGKIHRLHDDGRIPKDNPFVNEPGAYPSIYSLGHRNPQGLTLRPDAGQVWESEHGPRGGDELNLIEPGKNYGWPDVTYGMNYNGTPITSETTAPGIQGPATYWIPSLGVCGIAHYDGDAFPGWKGNILVAGLATRDLRRVVLDGDKVVSEEVLFKELGRMRDVASGPDGHPYAVVNAASGNRAKPGRIVRLVPN